VIYLSRCHRIFYARPISDHRPRSGRYQNSENSCPNGSNGVREDAWVTAGREARVCDWVTQWTKEIPRLFTSLDLECAFQAEADPLFDGCQNAVRRAAENRQNRNCPTQERTLSWTKAIPRNVSPRRSLSSGAPVSANSLNLT